MQHTKKENKINPNKTKTVRELGQVDISVIRAEIINLSPQFWQEQNSNKPNSFKALKQTEHIVFKFIRNFQSHLDSVEYPIWETWREKIEPPLNFATKSYGYQQGMYPRIMLAKLPPGSRIPLHIDANAAANYPHKIHIPIQTNDKAYFFVDKTTYHFAEGYAYEVNNKTRHGAVNFGETPRIHLIFEYCDLVKQQIKATD